MVIGGWHGRIGVGDGREGMVERCHQKALSSSGAPGGEWRGAGVGGDQPRGSFEGVPKSKKGPSPRELIVISLTEREGVDTPPGVA